MNIKKSTILYIFAHLLALQAVAPRAVCQQPLKPQTARDFECYIQSAEARMEARKAFLLADSDGALNEQLVRGQKIMTVPGSGPNPHKITGGQLYDWIGTVFVPGGKADRTVRMLQDYDHRTQYLGEIVSSSKLLCRKGDGHFAYAMRLKEPAVIDTENDVVWTQVDPQRWRCRSYSTKMQEVGKDRRYVQRVYSYWRVAQADKGVYIEAEYITLSGEFGSFMRAIGSMMGINPEKTLKRTLTLLREADLKPGLEFAAPATGVPECGEPFRPAGCQAPATTDN